MRHKVDSKTLYLRLFCNDVEPTCACGCNEKVKFNGLQTGFSKFVQGHAARVSNNWGHNENAQKKSQGVRREMHKRGEIKLWCKGLTKETDERIASLSEKGKNTILNNPNERLKRSKRMTENRLSKKVPDLKGSDHPQWKGGTSNLQPICRSRLHERWVRPILVRDQFTCRHCDSNNKLVVHHDKIRFADTLHTAMAQFNIANVNDLSFEEKDVIAEWIVDYHVKNDISGITLCEDCHKKAHASN